MLIFLSTPPSLADADIIIRDNFEYQVDRDGDPSANELIDTGGWSSVKAINDDLGSNACGYLYTVTSIDGFSGSFPGTNSSRVLCSEHLPETLDCDVGAGSCDGGRWRQSDTRFGYGAHTRVIPSNVWIQFWMYPQYYGDQLSRFYSGKFLYSCGDDTYFSTCTTAHLDWMGVFKEYQSYATECDTTANAGYFYYATQTQGNAEYDGSGGPCGETLTELGYTEDLSDGRFSPNVWWLVKINYDISTSNPTAKMWRKQQGETDWELVAEWIDGTTENLTWTPYTTSGYYWVSVLEMNDCYDMWMYFDDFVIAEDESDLPTYGETPIPSIQGIEIK